MSSFGHLNDEEFQALKEAEAELAAWEISLSSVPKNTPEVMSSIERGLEESELKELLLVPCRNKKELRNWIKLFLRVDLPDSTIDPDSNSNPLDMVWRVYETAVWYDKLKPEERHLKTLFYCSRGSFKTLCACILELMVMMHSGRNTVHIGLIESQAKNAYNMYFKVFLDKPYIKDWVKLNSILEKSEIKSKDYDKTRIATTLQVIPLTMNKTSSPRANFVVKDEIDKVKGEQVQAYENVHGMLTITNDKKMAMELDISSRDSAHGKVQDIIDNKESLGVKVFHWNRIDITEKCPDTRSGNIPTRLYIKKDTLITLNEDQYELLTDEEQKEYEAHWGLDGCNTRCKMFAACKGYLKNQRSKSKWLKPIESTQNDLLSAPSEEMAIAQLLCRVPPKKGLVYSDFDTRRNMKTPAEMYELAFNKTHPNERMTTDELIHEFMKAGFESYIGVDAGYHHPAAILLFIDPKQNVYVVKEHMPEEVDSEELAQWLKDNWYQYNVDRVFVDPESVDCTRAIKKQKFPVSNKVDKKRQLGIATVKGFIRRPATLITQLFVNKECMGLKYEFSRWSYKLGADGKPTDEAEKKNDHGLDGLRYVLHTLFGKSRGNTDYAANKPKNVRDMAYEEARLEINKNKLNPHNVASMLGERVIDNRHILENDDNPKPKKKSTTGFNFGETE